MFRSPFLIRFHAGIGALTRTSVAHKQKWSPPVSEMIVDVQKDQSGSPSVSVPQSKHRSGLGARLAQIVSTGLAMAVLAVVGYWGHTNGWKLPSFSELSGEASLEKADWCEAHAVPESECVECDPSLYPPLTDHGWCSEHGVHQCSLCHPEVAQVKPTPVITTPDRERAERGLAARERSANNNRCPLYRRRVQFASMEAMADAGVDVALAEEKPIVESIAAPAEISYDPTLVAHVSARTPGPVWRVEKRVGDPVKKDELLALIDAAAVGKAKADLLQAHAQVDLWQQTLARLRPLGGQVVSQQQILEAEASLREARVRLIGARQSLVNLGLPINLDSLNGLSEAGLADRVQFLGLPTSVTAELDRTTTTSNLLPVTAPFDGVVAERNVAPGEVAGEGEELFVIADPRRMWLNLDVRQEDVAYVTPGRRVLFRSDVGGVEAEGKVDWVSTTADEATRTVRARADLSNPDGRLRASTFGKARVVIREEPAAVMVPDEAVQWDGSCHIVFVRDKNFFEKGSPKLFHTRTVRPGVKDNGDTEMIAGILPGEVVAAKGSGVLRAQLLKNNLGAG